jgi:hypothetical protein
VPIQYFTILDRNIYWTVANRGSFHGFLTIFTDVFFNFKHILQAKRYACGRVMKRIWDINTGFSTSFVQNRENLSSRNSFVCNSLEVVVILLIFFR